MTSNELPTCFRLAKEVSQYSEHHQHKLGAVIYIKNKPVAVGYNQIKGHPMMLENHANKKTIHAELSAILSVRNKNRLKGATIVVYRERRNGDTGLSRPCESCQHILKKYGINTWTYTSYDGWITERVKC